MSSSWRGTIGAVASVLALLGSSPAAALSMAGVTVKLDKSGAGSVRLKGGYGGVAFDTARTFVLTLDRVALQIPLAQFTRTRSILTYRGGMEPGSLARVRIDTRKHRFLVDARGWTPPATATPFALGIGTDQGTDCRMVHLRDPAAGRKGKRARKRARLVFVAPRGDGDRCGMIAQPRTRPAVVEPGIATAVRVETEIDPTSGIDASTLGVFRLDATGAPAGAALCTMTPDPQRSDRTWACTATITGAVPGLLSLAVQGRAGDARVTSPGFALAVAAAPSDAEIDAVAVTGARIATAWKAAAARYGNSLAARMEALRVLAADPGLLSAGLSPDGLDLVVRYATGWLGGLILNTSYPDASQPAARRVRPTTTSGSTAMPAAAALPGVTNGLFRSCDGGGGGGVGGGGICCAAGEREPALGRGVLVWSPGFFAIGEPPYGPASGPVVEDARVIADTFEDHACLGFDAVDRVTGEAADVASVLRFPSYQTVLISSHGVVDLYDRTLLITGERLTRASGRRHDHAMDNADVESWVLDENTSVLGVAEDFIRAVPGRFPEHSIVYASYCYSARNQAASPYLALGAGAHFGFDWTVHSTYSLRAGSDLFDGLLARLQTTGDAFDRVAPKTDPNVLVGHIPAPLGPARPTGNDWIALARSANFVLSGSTRVAYVDTPRVEPELSALPPGAQATLTATVDGAGTCDLRYHWHNTAEYGHLTGDGGTDDFEGTGSTATYTANAGEERGTDDIGVEVVSPGGEEPVGVDCAAAAVDGSVTTTTTTSTTSTTLGCQSGVLESVEVFTRIQAGVSASAPGDTPPTKTFSVPPTTIELPPTGGGDQRQWDLTLSAGGAESHSMGSMSYLASPCRITAQGTFAESAIGGSATGAAMAAIDATLQIAFTVSQPTPYTITGFVRASGDPVTTSPTEEFLKCFGSRDFAEADLRSPTGIAIPIDEATTIYPLEKHSVNCSVDRGAATANGTRDDHADFAWSFTIDFGAP